MNKLPRRRILGLTARSATLAGVIGAGLRGNGETAPLPIAAAPPPAPVVASAPAITAHQPVRQVQNLLPDAPKDAIALTIDDGPDPRWTPPLLDLLRQHSVLATFSLIGMRARAYPELVRRITADGHALCNHSMTHPQPFRRCAAATIHQQIADAQAAITDAGGHAPALFRAPGGGWNAEVLAAVASHRMVPLGWSVDPHDWSRPGSPVITNRLLNAHGGDILLCHDGGGERWQTIESLRVVIPALAGRGLRFVAL